MITEGGARLAETDRIIAPYVTAWSAEQDVPRSLVIRPDGLGVGYADELSCDRDKHGVLWLRVEDRHGEGKPVFGQVHPARQWRAMRKLLCQVCAGPSDRTRGGVLWLLKDGRGDWADWPEGMGSTEPPICVQCVRTSMRRCPALQRGAVAVRVRKAAVQGVWGTLYRRRGFVPEPVEGVRVAYDDPAIRWVRAVGLIRELRGCSVVPLEELCDPADMNRFRDA